MARIGYDREAEEVYVEYHTGAVYGYRRVPPFVFDAFAEADSKGTFLNKTIKPRFSAASCAQPGAGDEWRLLSA